MECAYSISSGTEVPGAILDTFVLPRILLTLLVVNRILILSNS